MYDLPMRDVYVSVCCSWCKLIRSLYKGVMIMKYVWVRLDIDMYDLVGISRLYFDGVISLAEASESRAVKSLSEYERVMWKRAS